MNDGDANIIIKHPFPGRLKSGQFAEKQLIDLVSM